MCEFSFSNASDEDDLGDIYLITQAFQCHRSLQQAGANNDLTVLNNSSLFDNFLDDIAPVAPFEVKRVTFQNGYYLADGIYPRWASFVKSFTIARDEKCAVFKRRQEGARKDVERAFGVLQGQSLELGKNRLAFVQGEVPAKMEDPGLLTLPCRLGDSKPFDTLADLGSCVNIISIYLFKKLNIGLLEETDHIFGLADGTKSYPIGIVKDVEVHIGKLKQLNDFYVIDMKDPETPLLEDLIKNPIDWDKPPKDEDGAWHAKIRLIDPDGEEFTKTLQSIPTTRKLFERESPREIIDLDHFYDT
uniref:Ribosomal protein n=1 Tax=Tanacetum cinerariifolium TaxID=118510 RepID=A0A6L2JAQ6_TANCI|nr:ribosomal protein [Tanacetum cinerariifolium]